MVEVIKIQKHLAGKKILITGAGGLIGTALTTYLLDLNRTQNADIDVYALGREREALEKRFPAYRKDPHLHLIEGDVTCKIAPLDADFIIHAASPAHPLAYSQTPVDVMAANILGTLHVLDLARACGARVLFVSSGEIYGISTQPDSAFSETDYGYINLQDPRACYPESKRAAETLCASYHAQYGTDAVIARLCHVYGPTITQKNSRADAQFLRCAVKGEPIVMKSPGSQVRSFCYVKDAVTALLYILAEGVNGEVYNVANRSSVATIREYAETLAGICGVRISNDFPSEAEATGYSKVMRAVLDAKKLEALGWIPGYDLKTGLEDTVKCLRRQADGSYV